MVYSLGPDRKDAGGTVVFDWDAYYLDPSLRRAGGDILFSE